MTALMSHELKAITYVSFGAQQQNRFSNCSEQNGTQGLTVGFSFSNNEVLYKLTEIFPQLFTHCISMLCIEKFVLRYYVWFS